MALPQHKTCLSILRSILGPGAGGEARFAEKIGRSTSWVKKASCGQIPLKRDAAIAIAYETGVSVEWLLNADPTMPPVDKDENPYTLETYANYKIKDRESTDVNDFAKSFNLSALSFYFLLSSYCSASTKNRGGLFAFYLGEFEKEMRAKFGMVDITNSNIASHFAAKFSLMINEPDTYLGAVFQSWKPKTESAESEWLDKDIKPQKKQPSRKSKRPAAH